jgi:predicted DNA-binding ribbon-helix-helix protein
MLVKTAVLGSSPLPPFPLCWSVRHLKTSKRTTVRLEDKFWQEIEGLAEKRGMSWRQWAENALSAKPVGENSASWLRVHCLLMLKES